MAMSPVHHPVPAAFPSGYHRQHGRRVAKKAFRQGSDERVTRLEAGVVVAERFELERELGRGGMGAVWIAHHLSLDIPCAIKFISEPRTDSEVSRARFAAEARAAAKLRSSNVVQILDHGIWESTPYIAMELLEGETLADRLDRVGTLSLEETYAIASQVGRALSKAQELGIVHRDLKPENIFIAREGEHETVKVLDFGVAKMTGDESDRGVSTQTGQLLGTPNYLSPEQAHGAKELDHRSDLYALAIIVFECVTGELAFSADGLGELLNMIMSSKLPVPSMFVGTLPAEMDAWFARAAAREPAARFQSAPEMMKAFRNLVGDHLPTPRPSSGSSERGEAAITTPSAPDQALQATLAAGPSESVPPSIVEPPPTLTPRALAVLVVSAVIVGMFWFAVRSDERRAESAETEATASTASSATASLAASGDALASAAAPTAAPDDPASSAAAASAPPSAQPSMVPAAEQPPVMRPKPLQPPPAPTGKDRMVPGY